MQIHLTTENTKLQKLLMRVECVPCEYKDQVGRLKDILQVSCFPSTAANLANATS